MQGQREHATEVIHEGVAMLFKQVNDDLAVRSRAQLVAGLLEISSKLRKIVDLAVEDGPHCPVFIEVWLVTAFDVDDRQPLETESDALVDKDSYFVRTAMHQGPAHRVELCA